MALMGRMEPQAPLETGAKQERMVALVSKVWLALQAPQGVLDPQDCLVTRDLLGNKETRACQDQRVREDTGDPQDLRETWASKDHPDLRDQWERLGTRASQGLQDLPGAMEERDLGGPLENLVGLAPRDCLAWRASLEPRGPLGPPDPREKL